MNFASRLSLKSIASALGRAFRNIGLLLLLAIAATVVIAQISGDDTFSYSQTEDLINDVTALNPLRVYKVETPTTAERVAQLVTSTSLPISIGGGRFSQGGQIGYPESLHLDMREMNRVLNIDSEARETTVEAGITWRDLQEALDKKGLSVRIMQTYANFTVGGSLSVNVHGRYLGEGPLVGSVKSIRIVLADGSIVRASPNQWPELFYGAIGGYGGLGVIIEATLSVAENTRIERRTKVMDMDEYARYFRSEVRDNPNIVFHNADLYPPGYSTIRDVSWFVTDKEATIDDGLIPTDTEYWWQPAIAKFVGSSTLGKLARQYILEPIYYLEDRVVWRNWEASYDVRELEPADRDEYTYVLREYFVPVKEFSEFVPTMKEIFKRNEANIINVSVRHALPDSGTLLAWADTEVFAFVVYYRQGVDEESRQAVEAWSVEMIDAVLDVGGTWYLPYQIFASPEQFLAGYPRADEFFALKKKVDPNNRFRNMLWMQHYPENKDALEVTRASTSEYFRNEEQTILTIPEWYLVFNPMEYSDYLEAGNNPSDFPFFQSIDEYWVLYDRALAVADAYEYPVNSEYKTMLNVIGYSTTLEYLLKGCYETTIGRLTRWLADDQRTEEELIMQDAYRAYSDMIFHKAWYEFAFLDWVTKIWSDTSFIGPEFLRKTERKLFFTAEFAAKAGYAWLIKLAAESSYGETDKSIYATVVAPNDIEPNSLPDNVSLVASDGPNWLLSLPRWGAFTDVVPELLQQGFTFSDISGNQRIVATVVHSQSFDDSNLQGTTLFNSRIVSSPDADKTAYLVRVKSLDEFVQQLSKFGNSARLEHIYDY